MVEPPQNVVSQCEMPNFAQHSIEPALATNCIPAFHMPRQYTRVGNDTLVACRSPVTWGCYEAIAMTVLAAVSEFILVTMSCSHIVRDGSMWIKTIYGSTVLQSTLILVRVLFIMDDRLIVASETLEGLVVVLAGYILSWIATQLYENKRFLYRIAYPILLVTTAIHIGALLMSVIGVSITIGPPDQRSDLIQSDCHELSWIFLSGSRLFAVILCLVCAACIHKRLYQEQVSVFWREAKTKLVWCVAGIFTGAAFVEIGDDMNRAFARDCDAWITVSVSSTWPLGNLIVRLIARIIKFFLPMWTVVILFRALMPAREVKRRFGASGPGGEYNAIDNTDLSEFGSFTDSEFTDTESHGDFSGRKSRVETTLSAAAGAPGVAGGYQSPQGRSEGNRKHYEYEYESDDSPERRDYLLPSPAPAKQRTLVGKLFRVQS